MILGVFTSQIDRVYLSRALSTEQFGRYCLLCNLALAMMHFQVPIQRAFLPRIATAGSSREATAAMLKVTFGLIVLPCIGIAAFPTQVLQLWLHDPSIAMAEVRLSES